MSRCLKITVIVLLFMPVAAHAKNCQVDGVEIYVPDNLQPSEKLRGSLEFWNFDGSKRWVDSPHMRDFANRAKFVLAAGFPSRTNVAAAIGHPEYVNVPMIRFGHSAGGIQMWKQAVATENRARALAVVAHHHYFDNFSADPGDARGTVPTLMLTADRDFPHGSRALIMFNQTGQAAGAGWAWSTILGHGVSHMGIDPEAMRWMAYWLEDVAALQIPELIPADGRVALKPIDVTKGWVAYAEFVPSTLTKGDNVGIEPDRYLDIRCYPYAEAPGRGVTTVNGHTACYAWMPSERVAKYWGNYEKYGNIEGDMRVRQTRAWDVLNDGIEGTWQGYQGISSASWNCPAFDILNLPGFDRTDHTRLRWTIVSGSYPRGLSISPYGKITGTATTAGIYKYTLRTTFSGQSWDEVHYLPLRPDNRANLLAITIREPENLADVTLPLTLRWDSNQPLGLLEWHSSIDGDLGVADAELGASGTIRLDKLTPGTHAITLHANSSTTFQREAQTVAVRVLGGVDTRQKRP